MILTQAISRTVSFCQTHRKTRAFPCVAACAVLAAVFVSPPLALATTVRMVFATNTATLGSIDIELYDDLAPTTVANFLQYAGRGAYNTTIIHRRTAIIPDGIAVIQGGGYAFIPPNYYYDFPKEPPIQNEFSPSRPNRRGTIAMAKLPGNPDSATSEWFINLDDNNSAALDNTSNNGGYTVFGHVLDPGMSSVVDTIASYSTKSAYLQVISQGILNNVLFGWLPLVNPALDPGPDNLVVVTGIPNVKSISTIWGTSAMFTADPEITLSGVGTYNVNDTMALLSEFTPPPKNPVKYIAGILYFKAAGVMGAGRTITLRHGSTEVPNRYYAYGKTPDNQTDHWYDFAYNGTTGAEIKGDRIVLHFVDGLRGDDDLTTDSITHTGTAVLSTEFVPIDNGSGCTIAAKPSKRTDNGDWILISMFLVFVALVRRRVRH